VTVADSGTPPDTNHHVSDSPGRQEAREAALDAVEPERLLEGEDENTAYLDDAVHWVKVYVELLEAEAARFERRLDFWQARVAALEGSEGTEPA
jgi:hypothetical protein